VRAAAAFGLAVALTAGLVSAAAGVTRVARADVPGVPAPAAGAFDGKWKESALREDYTVQQWSPTGCGPAPISSLSGGGDVVSVHQEGDELAIAGGGRVFRTNQCYDENPTLSRESHSRDASGRSWRTRCSTPANDPRRATINTLVIATSDTHLQIMETGRYEIVLADGRCIADVQRSRNLDLVARDVASPAVAQSLPTPVQTATPPTLTATPPSPLARPTCDSPGDPARLEVRPSRKLLRTGESFSLRATVVDANGCPTGASTQWSVAPGGGTTLTVDGSGRVSAPDGAPEGSGQIIASAAGRSARVTIDVASAAHYAELLASSGLDSQGENDSASVAQLATGSIGGADAHAEDDAHKRRNVFLAIIGTLTLALGAAAWFFARRQKRVAQLEKHVEAAYQEKRREADARRSQKKAAHDVAVRAHEESLRRAKDAARDAAQRAEQRAGSAAPVPASAAPSAGSARMVCPTCRREYPGSSSFCPQDATKLVPMSAEPTSGPAAGAGSICPTCKRGFPAGTRTCPHDGEELVPYAVHAAVVPRPGTGTVAMVGRGKICPTCGGRFDGAAAFCGKDGTALVLIN